LRKLEERYGQDLLVIGIHSGKYHAERKTPRIQDAASRLGVHHPIVNDRQFRIWRSFAVSAWPTIVALDGRGYVVGAHAGEFSAEALTPFLDGLVGGKPKKTQTDPEMNEGEDARRPVADGTLLRYPGKVAVDGVRIAISDSGNHRVILGRLDGNTAAVERVIGGGRRGFADGPTPEFDSPQGLAFDGDMLLVADAENHSIREIDLASGTTRTLAGTGNQLRTVRDKSEGALSSPWDLTISDGQVYVAMAGMHQLWVIDVATRAGHAYAGMGGEDIRDGSREEALLAQPMGITHRGNRLYFADSESSAIRWCDMDSGEVATIVGTGLFDFGDTDGAGDQVRLQHPQGVAIAPDGRLLIADSYNDCLKWIDPASRRSTKWIAGLSEPSGVACGPDRVYVADTNAHRIVTVDYESGEITPLTLR
jgi:DNA-binding beta-propeller fold protein YncE